MVAEHQTVIDALLEDQQRLSAVERFSHAHDSGIDSRRHERYRALLPVTPLTRGEQLAFEVDLDKCSGCKACVTACHSLNGLDDGEAWREVGLLVGEIRKKSGWYSEPAGLVQHVTTACHHCVDPACLNGCPVLAYDKDPLTGIVRHLDDQCIGCQYCVLKCPYDVPKYNPRLGIVRKCDMCANRLADGEPPACAQACPNEAIRITKVEVASVAVHFRERGGEFLSGSPSGSYTLPTTTYLNATPARNGHRNERRAKAADHDAAKVQPAHWPLVLMLVLSQGAVGVMAASVAVNGGRALVATAAGILLASMLASVCHLGRPLGAWRAFMGLRKSWLSREIVAFSAVIPLVGGALVWTRLTSLAAVFGVAAVFCSMMIYHDTRRAFWNWRRSAPLFVGTMLILGSGAAMIHEPTSSLLLGVLVVASLAKLLLEAVFVRTQNSSEPLQKSAALIRARFGPLAFARIGCLFIGAIMIPLLAAAGVFGGFGRAAAACAFCLLLTGEVIERYLFFRATDAPKMPGGFAA